jgi:AcrR family transcriptional regulator
MMAGTMPPKAPAHPAPRRPPGGSQIRADRTRALIIEETIRCIREDGFAAASASHITRRAGVTWGVIQYHFGGRDELLMAVVYHSYRKFLEALEQIPEGLAEMSIRQRVEIVVTAAWEGFSTPTSMAALEILVSTRTFRDATAAQHIEELAAALARLGKEIGQGLDPARATTIGNLVWTGLQGMVLAQLVTPTPVDATRERRALVELIATYIDQQAHAD